LIAALPGFGNSFKSGPLATDGHMAGGTGTATLGTYNNNLFYGANGSFTYKAIIQIPAKNPSGGKGMILGRDGQNGSRGWDLKLGPTANTLAFALHGDPMSGSDNGYGAATTEDTDDDTLAELTLTIAVRNGDGAPVFTGTPSPTATVDGITCTIEGSVDLAFPNSVVTETDPPTGLPALPSGWEYRRFRLNASNGLSGSGFLRVGVAPQP
jgi:hypothetical protein